MSDMKRILVLATEDGIAKEFQKAIGATIQNLPFSIEGQRDPSTNGGRPIQLAGQKMETWKEVEVASYNAFVLLCHVNEGNGYKRLKKALKNLDKELTGFEKKILLHYRPVTEGKTKHLKKLDNRSKLTFLKSLDRAVVKKVG